MRLRSNTRAAEDASLQMRVLDAGNLMLPQVSQGGAEWHGLETTAAFQGSVRSQLESVFLCSVTSVLGFTVSVTVVLGMCKGEQDEEPGPLMASVDGAAPSMT